MEKVRVFVGLVLLVCIGTVESQTGASSTVKVNDPIMVEPGQEVNLNCIGSNPDIAYYIKNRASWSFTNMKGDNARLTFGFYVDTSDTYAKGLQDEKRITFAHNLNSDQTAYLFNIALSDIQYSDDGEYTCALNSGEDGGVISEMSTSITVVRPARKLTLELHDNDGIVAAAESHINGSNAVAVPPGKYMVKCVSEGSNPQPKMSLRYNNDPVYVVQNDKKVTTGPGPTYMSTFNVAMIELGSMSTEQLLICESKIEGDYFETRKSGINLLVKIDKPEFKCANLTTAPGERYRKISCSLVAKNGGEAPKCENVMWKFGDSGNFHKIQSDMKYSDNEANPEWNIMESKCSPIVDGVEVDLNLYTVTAKHMETTFYVVYGIGDDAEQYPIQIDLKAARETTVTSTIETETSTVETETSTIENEKSKANVTELNEEISAGSMPSPMTILTSLLMAFVSRHLARSL